MTSSEWFCFNSEESLLAAILAELVPRVARHSATMVREDRHVWLRPRVKYDNAAKKRLSNAGVEIGLQPISDQEIEVGCWAEALSLKPSGELGSDEAPVLFLLPNSQGMLDVAGEMLRLGCQQQSFCLLSDGRCLIRAIQPPYYTLARAFDKDGGLRAYTPLNSKEMVWIESGWTHPAAGSISPVDDSLALVGQESPWDRVAKPKWQDIHRIVNLAVSPSVAIEPNDESLGVIQVPVVLRPRSGEQTATLWVLRRNAEIQVEELLRGAPQTVIDELTFAIYIDSDGETTVAIRSRPPTRNRSPINIDVEGEAYVPHEQLRHLYLPHGQRLDPPLRRDTLRDLLAPRNDQIVWLRKTKNGFTPEVISDSAFEPMSRWVEYVIGCGAAQLQPWTESTLFHFEAFEGVEEVEVAPPNKRRKVKRKERAATSKIEKENDDDLTPPDVPQREQKRRKKKKKNKTASGAPKKTTQAAMSDEEALRAAIVKELEETEAAFLKLGDDRDADDPERIYLWARLARINSSLGRHEEAGLCWTRAIWNCSPERLDELSDGWMAAEVEASGRNGRAALAAALSESRPSRRSTRLVASILNSSDSMQSDNLLKTQRWLEGAEENLDLRALWLAHSALSRLAGGDSLGLARCRDRVLSRLHRGLSVDREVPSFLRRLDSSVAESDRQQAVTEINAFLQRAPGIKRKKMPTEADAKWTWAIVRFIAAYAMAKLVREDRAQALSKKAQDALSSGDIHSYLSKAYSERIEQALAGLPPETPLSQNVLDAHSDLGDFGRYKIDRLRLVSEVLEPGERLEPTNAFLLGRKSGGRNVKGKEFDELQGVTQRDKIADIVETICAKGAHPDTSTNDRVRLFTGAMDFFPHLSEAQAFPHLTSMVEHSEGAGTVPRVYLLEKALVLAGHFGQEELVERLAVALRGALLDLEPKQAKTAGSVLGGMLRTLWRLGMRQEARAITEAMDERSKEGNGSHLLLRAHLGVAYSILEMNDKAKESHREAMDHIVQLSGGSDKSVLELLRVCRALAWSLAAAPREYAFGVLKELEEKCLPTMTDSFNTNSHFCLAVVGFSESMIIGYTGLGETIGRRTRRWLDEDEFLVRQRIHQDMKAAG